MLFFYLSMLETPEEKQKFTEIYESNKQRMFSVAKGVLRDEHLAEDAVHEAFVRLIKYFKRVENFSCNQTRNYLVIMVRRTSIDMYNKRRKVIEVAFDESYDGQQEHEDFTIQLDHGELLEVIEQLPDIYKEVLYLSYFLDLSVSEIAGSLDLSVSAVKLRLMRARQKLRAALEGIEAMERMDVK